MKNIKYIIGLFFTLVFFASCEEDTYKFGDIVAPENVQLVAKVVGQDLNNPELLNGDGTGFVELSAIADNAISFNFNFGDGNSEVASTGVVTHRYTKVGINKFTVIVSAIGTGGITTTTSIEVDVFSSFTDVETENLLSGISEGDSKTWYWASNINLHVGLGPVTDGENGEFAREAWWNTIEAWDEEKSCMYDNEFVFTRTADGITFEQTQGPAFIPATYGGELGVSGDTCYDETVATNMFGVKNVSFFPSSSKAALEGKYNDKPYKGTSFTISDGGFMGWFVGASTYDIISITDDALIVRIIQAGDGFAWYHKFTSIKPVKDESSFTNLVWSDEFETAGAPDATNWTYDLGAGGWGNGEAQTYTSNAENVVVENGVLKITAKADGSGGYTSARLKSQSLQSFKYGRIDVSAKLPASQGSWPAIWMLGDSFSTVGWPVCGEIDIMEQKGADKNNTLGTLHWLDTTSSTNSSFGKTTEVTNASSEFHTYSLEWTEDALKMYVDDVKFFEMANNADLPFNDKFFMIFNIAMGGTLGGTIDPAFTEDSMEIDYVRVYQ